MASVSYKIGGKYDGKAVKDAKKDITSLKGTITDVANVVKGLAVIKAVQQITKIANATKTVFLEQNKALSGFNTAVRQTNQDLDRLNALRKELSNNNFIDDDSLNNAMKYGMQMGLTGDRLEQVTRAAINMSASGVKPLDAAMKELTKTELKNSDALDEIAKRYDGFASAMANTFGGRNTQWANSLSDLQAAIGSIPSSLSFIMQGKLLEPLNKVTEWIVTNRDYIIKMFLSLPQIATVTFNQIGEMLQKTFTGDGISNIFGFLFEQLLDGVGNAFESIQNMVKLLFDSEVTFIKNLLNGNVFKIFAEIIAKIGNKFIETINEAIQKIKTEHPKIASFLGLDSKTINFRFETDLGADSNAMFDPLKDSFKEYFDKYRELQKKNWNESAANLKKFSSFYNADDFASKIKNALDSTDLPEDLKSALEGVTYNAIVNGETPQEETKDAIVESNTTVVDALKNSAGELGQLIEGIIMGVNGNWQPLIAFALQKVSEVLISLSDSVANIVNIVTFMLNEILPPVVEMLEAWLEPIFFTLKVITDFVKMLLDLITPWLTPAMEYTIKSVLVVVVTVLDLIYNAVVAIHNLFASSKNDWAYRDIGSDVNTIWKSKATTTTTMADVTTNNASASYSAARDIYVNITYSHSYVNGDARQIALSVYNEIKMAQAMGY